MNGDGCSADCIIESNWTCTGSPSICIPECPMGMVYNNYTYTCAPICGDGTKLSTEECDDENSSNGDGCSADCIIEPGFKCFEPAPTSPSSCYPICSDGIVAGSETCDDGNTMSGDG